MDLGTTIIIAILVALTVVPIWVMRRNRLKKESHMMQALKEIASRQNGEISQYEFCGDYVIGIDTKNKYVFFYKKNNKDVHTQFVNLAAVQNCKVEKITKSFKHGTGDGNIEFTARLELHFLPKAADNAITKLELFDEKINSQLTGEIQMASKWAKLINGLMHNKQ